MNTLERKLPIGIQTFEKMRAEGCLYVDKTAIIYQIAATKVPYFLSRPRRFGKSLLISTFEAYFKVAHDEKHAFIVQVGDLEVKVLGTSFNVSAYEDAKDVTVVLLEGKVGVYAQKMSHIMKPGDKIEYNKATHKITATQVHPSDYIEWTKGNIYFEKESLENIMKTLSRIYDVEIRFDSNKLPNEYFTGTIPGGGIQNALNILMLTSPFYYEMDGSVIVLKEK